MNTRTSRTDKHMSSNAGSSCNTPSTCKMFQSCGIIAHRAIVRPKFPMSIYPSNVSCMYNDEALKTQKDMTYPLALLYHVVRISLQFHSSFIFSIEILFRCFLHPFRIQLCNICSCWERDVGDGRELFICRYSRSIERRVTQFFDLFEC